MNQNIPQPPPISNSKKMPLPIPRKKVEETPKVEAIPKVPSAFEDSENFLADFSEELILDLEKTQQEPDNQKRKQKEIMLSIAAFTEGKKKIDVYNVLEQERKKAADTALLKKLETLGFKSLDEMEKVPLSQRAQWEADYEEAIKPLRSLEQEEEQVLEAAKQTMFNALDSEVRAAYIASRVEKNDIESLQEVLKSPEAKLANGALLAEQNPKVLFSYVEAMKLNESPEWKAMASVVAWQIVSKEPKPEVIESRLEALGISKDQQKDLTERKKILEKPIDLATLNESMTPIAAEISSIDLRLKAIHLEGVAIMSEGRSPATSQERKGELATALENLKKEKTQLQTRISLLDQTMDQQLEKGAEYEIAGDKAIAAEQLLALIIEQPNRASELLARQQKRDELRAEIQKYDLLSNDSAFAPLRGELPNGEPVVYKSKKKSIYTEESIRAKYGVPPRLGIRAAENHLGEKMADLHSEIFDENLVPVVVIDKGPEGVASRQEFVKGSIARNEVNLDAHQIITESITQAVNEGRSRQEGIQEGQGRYLQMLQQELKNAFKDKKYFAGLQNGAMFEVLEDKDDAHSGNYLWDGINIRAIDNSNIHSDQLMETPYFVPEAGNEREEHDPATDRTKGFALEMLYDEDNPASRDIPQHMLDRIEAFKKSPRLQAVQRKAYHLFYGPERGEKKMARLLQRGELLLKYKRFPKSQSDITG